MVNEILNRYALVVIKYIDSNIQRDMLNELAIILQDYDINKKCFEVSNYVDYVPDAVKYFAAYQSVSGRAKSTVQQYLLVLNNFFKRTQLNLEEIQSYHIIAYLQQYKKYRNVSDRTLDTIRIYLNNFFDWCNNNEIIKFNPCKNVQPIKYQKKEIPSLSLDELEHLRDYCNGTREKAIIEFLISTGCRVSELCHVNLKDINNDYTEVELFGKGSKYRRGYISPKCKIALQKYIKNRNDTNEALFVYMRKPYNRLKKDGVEKIMRDIMKRYCDCNTHVTPHVLRHTFAQLMYDKGAKLEDIQHLLGHVNISTTQIYARNNKDNAKLAHKKYIS